MQRSYKPYWGASSSWEAGNERTSLLALQWGVNKDYIAKVLAHEQMHNYNLEHAIPMDNLIY